MEYRFQSDSLPPALVDVKVVVPTALAESDEILYNVVENSVVERSTEIRPFKFGRVVDGEHFCPRPRLERGLVHFTRVGGGQDRTIHLAATTVKVGDRLPFRATLVQDGVTFACYDGDGIQFKPNPNNRYNPFVEYKNEFATITSDGLLTAVRPGPVMVLARDGKLNKEIFPVTVVPGE